MNKSVKELLQAYNCGRREFRNWDFEEDDSARDMDLRGIKFKRCFSFLDFKNANLENSEFIECNIKTADFRGANLENGLIKNCSVESTMFKGARVENFRFEENYCYGATTSPGDFERVFINTDEA